MKIIVLIMTTSWCPPDKIAEAAKKFIEVSQKIPPDPSLGKVLVQAVSSDKDGIKNISIYEIEKGKYEEALNRIAKSFVEYNYIEGYRYEIETLMTMVEAMPLLGLTPP